MPLTAGTRLGTYEIVGPLGAGGMGEVYRARDASLGREVAVKVLPGAYSQDPERLRRFVQEAQAAAALDHPNILAIYQIGQHENAPFIVSELLKGATLRERLHEGALPVRKALDYTIQTARGLAAAHDKGIIHRDLKPDNVFVTDDGRVKILDFGVAKLTRADAPDTDATLTLQTGAGTVLGTVGYMSPEQVRGQAVDARSDLFSLGAMLYEMLSGRRAFHKNTAADTMTAVLKEDPPELLSADHNIPPVLDRIIKRCLEKNPQERFQSARDLAFALEDMTSVSTAHAAIADGPVERWKSAFTAVAIVIAVLATGSAGALWGTWWHAPTAQPAFQRLTFRRGALLGARFAPDAKTVVYGAAWDGNAPETFVVTTESPESRSLGLPKTDVHAVSPNGDIALSLRTHGPFPPRSGVLARIPLLGGAAPREIRDDVEYADWGKDGTLAVTLDTGVGDRLEYPIGTVLYDSEDPIHEIRVSPDGERVAFQEPAAGGVSIAVIDRAKKKTTLTKGWREIDGLAWTPSGDEIWFAGHRQDMGWGLFAVSIGGAERLLLRSPGILALHDLAKDGRVLVSRETRESGIRYASPGSREEQDLSWLDRTVLDDLTDDGAELLFSEIGDAGGAGGSVYLRKTDGTPAVRLGDGIGVSLSPDRKWALTTPLGQAAAVLLPTGAGAPIRLKGSFAQYWGGGEWLPDSRGIVFAAVEAGHGPRLYAEALDGEPRPISKEGLIVGGALSPDGRRLATMLDRKGYIIDVAHGTAEPLPGVAAPLVPVAWTADARSLFMSSTNIAATIVKVDVATGTQTPWKTLLPADRAGVTSVTNLHITPDERSYAYTYNRRLSELYVITGLK